MMAKRFKLKRSFAVQLSASKIQDYKPGIYDVPSQMSAEHAKRAMQQRVGEYLVEKAPAKKKVQKKAPENKVVATPENKAAVAEPAVRGRGAGSKSDA